MKCKSATRRLEERWRQENQVNEDCIFQYEGDWQLCQAKVIQKPCSKRTIFEWRVEINDSVVTRLWGGDDVEWIAQPSNGFSGGILSFWRKGILNVLFTFSHSGYVGVAAQVGVRVIYFVNVYSGCSIRRKRELWSSLLREKSRVSG